MPNPFGAPEITVKDVHHKRKAGEDFVWLDVREPWEFARVRIRDERVVLTPISDLMQREVGGAPLDAIDKNAEIIVLCHHGIRSAQVVVWLRQQGWGNAVSMAGGVDAWAREVDPSIGVY